MKDSLQFHFDWEHPEGVRGPELLATWASFRITIDDACVTRVFDQSAKTIRDNIYVPLYPLAEWIVWNWWSLLDEPEVRATREQRGFSARHNVRCVGDGIVMPDMEFLPLGEHVQIIWSPRKNPFQNVEFLNQGKKVVRRKELFQVFFDFVQSVCARLEQEGVTGTWLQQGWGIVSTSINDPEEAAFCKVVAMLGKDPYALERSEEELVIKVAGMLPESLLEDCFLLSDWSHILKQAEHLREDLGWIQHRPENWERLKQVRDARNVVPVQTLPWDQGYDLARHLRQNLGIPDDVPPSSYETIAKWLDIPVGQLANSIREETYGFPGMEALVADNENGSPAFILKEKGRPENQIFSLCRGLCEYLVYPHTPRLVSSVNTEGQKRNRAFAAEFLAPADAIKKRLVARDVSQEDVDELACDMGVSPFVIQHQIMNHGLAVVGAE